MKALIVSYFGPRTSPEVREKRKEYHFKQLEWLFAQGFNPSDIWISSKDYDQNEFFPGVVYFDRPSTKVAIPPALGRNQLLRAWYETDDDWCLLLDNDSILDDRNQGNIIEWLEHNALSEVDAFVPVNPGAPGRGAFNRLWEDRAVQDNWVFERGELKGSLMFLKNLKKHHNKELYFDEGDRCKSAEDYFFGFDMVELGMVPMWCNNIVLKELATSTKESMLWKTSDTTRQDFQVMWKTAAANLYPQMEFKGGTFYRSAFYDKYRTPKRIDVPKSPEDVITLM